MAVIFKVYTSKFTLKIHLSITQKGDYKEKKYHCDGTF